MAKSTETPFTAEIRERVGNAGVSLREFMRKAGLPTSAIYRWETGHTPREATKAVVYDALEKMEKGE